MPNKGLLNKNNNNNTDLAGHVYLLGIQEMHAEFRLGNILKNSIWATEIEMRG
jgi:hypothetical protein